MILAPYIIACLAVSGYALLGPIAKKIGLDLPPFTFVAIASFLLCIFAALIGYVYEREKVAVALQDFNWGGMIVFSLVNLAAYVLYLIAIRKMPIAQYNMFSIMMPVVGGLFAVFLLKEQFHARYILSILVMAVGILIAIGPDLRSK